jgi:hypothetical protein
MGVHRSVEDRCSPARFRTLLARPPWRGGYPISPRIEGAHLLANEARPFLTGCGFDDDRILRWAEASIAEEGSGDAACFVSWIHTCRRPA